MVKERLFHAGEGGGGNLWREKKEKGGHVMERRGQRWKGRGREVERRKRAVERKGEKGRWRDTVCSGEER